MLDEPLVNPEPDPGEAEQVLAPLVAPDTGPAREWAEASPPLITVHPDELPEGDTHLSVRRTFCFADLSGFTGYTRDHGPHEAVAMLGDFRRITRSVAAKRGCGWPSGWATERCSCPQARPPRCRWALT